jgi:hypothetical protein
VGIPAGTSVALLAHFHVSFSLNVGECSDVAVGTATVVLASADSLLQHGVSIYRFSSKTSSPFDTILTLPLSVVSHQPFTLNMDAYVRAYGAFASATGDLYFSGLPSGAEISSCQGFVNDQAVGTLFSVAGIDVQPDRVRIAWYSGLDAGASYSVFRSRTPEPWVDFGRFTLDGRGRLEFVDLDVTPGGRYGYRIAAESGQALSEELWVTVPPPDNVMLRAPFPNPSAGQASIQFRLSGTGAARLALLDLGGRERFGKDITHLGQGDHQLSVPADVGLAPGVYWIFLNEGSVSRSTKMLVLR